MIELAFCSLCLHLDELKVLEHSDKCCNQPSPADNLRDFQ